MRCAGGALAGAVLLLASSLAGRSAAVPPPIEQLTADCRNPVYASDQLVCGDPVLRALDADLAAALSGFVAPDLAWFEPQEAWFKRRSRCAFSQDHYACVMAAYRERLAVVRPSAPPAGYVTVRCDDTAIAAVYFLGELTVIIDSRARIRGIAAPVTTKTSWRFFLSGSKRGTHLSLQTLQGGKLSCQMHPQQ